jgi:hypothetical protein
MIQQINAYNLLLYLQYQGNKKILYRFITFNAQVFCKRMVHNFGFQEYYIRKGANYENFQNFYIT